MPNTAVSEPGTQADAQAVAEIDRLRVAEGLKDTEIARVIERPRDWIRRHAGTRADSARRYAARAAEAAAAPPAPVQDGTVQVYSSTPPAKEADLPPVELDVELRVPRVWAALARLRWGDPPPGAEDTVLATFVPIEWMHTWLDCTTLDGVITRRREGGALRGKLTDERVRHGYEPGSGSTHGARNGAINRAKFLAYEYGLVLLKDDGVIHQRGRVRGIYVIGYIDAYFSWHIGIGPRTPHDLARTFDECFHGTGTYPVTRHFREYEAA